MERLIIIHFTDGFFDDIFRDPSLDGKGWHGFTRDYHQSEGAFSNDDQAIIKDLDEYIADMKIYENRKFDYKETKQVYDLIYSWLIKARENSATVKVSVF